MLIIYVCAYITCIARLKSDKEASHWPTRFQVAVFIQWVSWIRAESLLLLQQ